MGHTLFLLILIMLSVCTCLRIVPSMYYRRSMLCKNWFKQVELFPVWIIIHVVLLLKSANWGMVFHCLLMPPFIHSPLDKQVSSHSLSVYLYLYISTCIYISLSMYLYHIYLSLSLSYFRNTYIEIHALFLYISRFLGLFLFPGVSVPVTVAVTPCLEESPTPKS